MNGDEKMDKVTEVFIRQGKKIQVKEVFVTDLFAALGGSLPETTIEKLLDKIDKIYYGND